MLVFKIALFGISVWFEYKIKKSVLINFIVVIIDVFDVSKL